MAKQTHLVRRGGKYWFRRRIPLDLVGVYKGKGAGTHEIRFSLDTGDRAIAIARVQIETLRITQEFDHQRSMMAKDPATELTSIEIDRLAAIFHAELLQKDEDDRNTVLSSEDFEHLTRDLEISDFELGYSLARGLIHIEREDVHAFLEKHGIKLVEDSEGFIQMARAMHRAKKKAVEMMRMRHRGELVETPKVEPLLVRSNTGHVKAETFESLCQYWLAQPAKTGGPKGKSAASEAKTIILKFRKYCGDITPSKVLPEHVVALKDKMLEEGSKPATINKSRGILAAIFACAFKNNKIASNPFQGMEKLSVERVRHKKYYTIDELQMIFNSPVFTNGFRNEAGKGEAAFWMPLIALYTGARLNEVGQLYTEDIQREEGIDHFVFVHDPPVRFIKDKRSRRVPIHPDLIRFGLLAYVDLMKRTKQKQLFPLLKVTRKNGKVADKWGSTYFSAFVKEGCGITRIAKPFHAFRDCFTEYGRRSGMDREHRMRMEGHSLNTVGDRDYGDQDFPLRPLAETMRKLTFEGLDLSHLYRRS